MLDTATTEAVQAPEATAAAPETAKPETAAAPITATTEEPSEADKQAAELADRRSLQQQALDKARAEKAAKNGTAPPEKAPETKPATVATGDKNRNPDGTFAPKPGAEPKPDEKAKDAATADTGDKKPEEPKKSEYQPPAHWTKEAKAKFANLEPEVQKYLVEDSKRIAQAFSTAGNEKKQLKTALESFKPITETISKHIDTLKGWGLNAHEAFDGLMTTAKQLDTDPAGAIKRLAADYNVNIATLLNDSELSSLPPDPRLEQAATENAALKRQLAQAQRVLEAERKERDTFFARQRQSVEERAVEEQRTKAQQYRGEIDRLASELPHFEELEADIADLLPTVMKKFPNDQVGALREAHRIALHANPTLSQSLIQKQIEEADAKRRAEQERFTSQARTAAKLNAPANASGLNATQDPDAYRVAALQKARAKAAASRSI